MAESVAALSKVSWAVMAAIGLSVPALLGAENASSWHGPGMAYYCDFDPSIPRAVHVVKIDRSQKDLELITTMGGGDQIGMASLSEQVRSIKSDWGQAVAAINGDYFNVIPPFLGDPMNLQILHGGELVSGPDEERSFMYLDAKGEPHATNATSKFTITFPNGKTLPFGLNETPMTGQAVLYTRAAGASTRVDGVDLILERNGEEPWLPLHVGQILTARVKAINRNGYSKITPDIMVLSLSPRTMNSLPTPTNNMVLKICTATAPDLAGATLAIGGGPTLLRAGKVREFDGIQVRHPRSAVGWNDKYFYFVQVDGRQVRYSMGMTYPELAAYFAKLGCTYAINLDGGGSCTTWVAGRVVNSPSQGRERQGANALVVVRRKLGPDGKPVATN